MDIDPRNDVTIFAGRFGSGKTEIALNYTAQVAQRATVAGSHVSRPVLVDLDLVTPYFRSREMVQAMRQAGADVIAPLALTQAVDVPGVTPEILGAIQQRDRPVIIDVGGDPQGARALGQYREALHCRGYQMHFVVNPYRPYTATPEAIRDSIVEIERSAMLRVTALVSNPNLLNETDLQTICDGHAVVEEASRLLGLPVAFLAVTERFAPYFSPPPLPLRRHLSLPWEITSLPKVEN